MKENRVEDVGNAGPQAKQGGGDQLGYAACWCCQGVRAEPAVLSGVFLPNLLTLPSCCTDVFIHWEYGGKRGVFDASKVDNQTKNLLTKEYYLRWQ